MQHFKTKKSMKMNKNYMKVKSLRKVMRNIVTSYLHHMESWPQKVLQVGIYNNQVIILSFLVNAITGTMWYK